MTNEEILKRFQFDLEMGLFSSSLNSHLSIFKFSEVLNDREREFKVFKSILRKLDYYIPQDLLKARFADGISIDKSAENFWTWQELNPDIDKYCIKIPDYLKEWKLYDE